MAEVVKSIKAGGDYTSVTAWEAAINNTTYPDAGTTAVGEMYDENYAVGASTDIDFSATNVTAGILRAEASNHHDGTAGTGPRMTNSGAGNVINLTTATTFAIRFIEINLNGTGAAGVAINIGANVLRTVENCIIHDGSTASFDSMGVQQTTDRDLRVMNCLLYDFSSTEVTVRRGAGVGVAGAAARPHEIINNTVYKVRGEGQTGYVAGIRWVDDGDMVVRNNICVDCHTTTTAGTAGDFIPSAPSLGTVSHNLASDTTASGTGSLDSKTSANQFVSTTDGSENLHLKTGADAIDAGTDLVDTPANVKYDIDNRDRDAEGDTWDMGADELVVSGPPVGSLSLLGVGR